MTILLFHTIASLWLFFVKTQGRQDDALKHDINLVRDGVGKLWSQCLVDCRQCPHESVQTGIAIVLDACKQVVCVQERPPVDVLL